eukprot:scaffold39928_cov45-Attheya_sp.AAC.2
MRIAQSTAVFLAVLATLGGSPHGVVDARKPSRSVSSAPPRRGGSSRRGPPKRSGASASSSRRKAAPPSEDDEEEEDVFDVIPMGDDDSDAASQNGEDSYDDYEEEMPTPVTRRPPAGGRDRRGPPPRRGKPEPPASSQRGRSSASNSRRRFEEDEYYDEEEDYPPPRRSGGRNGGPPPRRGGPPPRGNRRGPPPSRRRGGRQGDVVPYVGKAAGAFTRGLTAMRESMPDLKESAIKSVSAARETTSKLSSNLYRDVKGLASSELEQVTLKATRPDDTPVKGKHVERLVGVTYQIGVKYDIYDSVLRKLWNKMAERDWRTKIKALYILHRFSADGAPEHQPALKARLREMRRTHDPKRKEKFFNSKQLLAGDASPQNVKFRAFMARYAHYVLLRTQCFGGMFREITDSGNAPSSKRSRSRASVAQKPITATALRVEHLEASRMLLKDGCACALKDGEECENTAMCVERVAADLIGLTTAVATSLNRALSKDGSTKGTDAALLQKWCEFYSDELLPQTKSMVKKTSAKLDAYGLFLPSRMGASVSPELLQKEEEYYDDEEA